MAGSPAQTSTRTTDAGELSGLTIGRFAIRKYLGGGGMGEVYLADDTKLKRPVAMKRLTARIRGDTHYRERFFHEAERASQLNDRNIAAIYDVLEENGEVFLLMEYVEGQTLRQRLQQQPVSVEQFLNIAVQCAGALAAAHAHRIVHCDVKPENIMLTAAGQVKILDFGLAKRFVRPEESTMGLSGFEHLGGTAGYTAPEVLREQQPDERADIFSLGVVFYEALAGTPPFRAASFVGIAEKILHQEAVPLYRLRPDISPGIERVVFKMLAKDRDLRYTTAEELLADLRALRGSTSQTIAIRRYVPRLDRKKWVSLVLLLVVCLLLGLAIPRSRNWAKELLISPKVPQQKHLAVLPFNVPDGDPSKIAFSYGLAETLSARLARLSDQHALDVVAPSEIRSQQVTSAEQARQTFAANLVLEGTLRQSGNIIRVNYVLVDTQTRSQLRADAITADASDSFAVEDRVARSVLDSLELELGAVETRKFLARGTAEPAAYDFYLQGRGYLQDFHKTENLENAITVFQHALERDPGYALAYAGLGEAYWQRFSLSHDKAWVEKALSACNRAVALAPGVADGHDCLGTAYNGTGKYEKAAEQFRLAMQLEPTDDAAFCGLASALERLGKTAEAERTYQQAIQVRPNYWAVYNWLGQFYSRQGHYREAGEMFAHVVRLQPDNVRGYSNLGGMLILEGRYEDAVPIFQRAAAIRPSADVFSNLATTYFYLQRYSEAAQAYQQAAELDPRDYLIQGNLGDLHYGRPGGRNDAETAYRKAIALATEEMRVNPRDAALLGHLAKYHAMLGEKDFALAALKRGLAINSSEPELLFEAAVVYQQSGETEQALRWLGRSRDAGFSLTSIRDEPVFESLHGDPRFQKLVQGTGPGEKGPNP